MDKELEKKVRDEIAKDINNLVNNQVRKTGRPYPMFAQVALANLLAEGRKACVFSSVSFPKWIRENIKGIRYEECKRLAQAGESGNPEKFITARRENNRKNNIAYRKRVKASYKNVDFVTKRFHDLSAEGRKEFFKNLIQVFPPFDGYDEEAANNIDFLKKEYL